jgi:hypothetical protein
VEEATAATESMKEQALSLLQVVNRFDLGTEPGCRALDDTPINLPAGTGITSSELRRAGHALQLASTWDASRAALTPR